MSADAAITFKRRGMTIGEAYFDPAAADAPEIGRVDLMRVVSAPVPGTDGDWRQLHALVLDLDDDEDGILGQMEYETRRQIRRAADRDLVEASGQTHPTKADVDAFADFYDRFAAVREVAPVFRPRLYALAAGGGLALTTATGEDGEPLVAHAYVAVRGRGCMLYSGSAAAMSGDNRERNRIGRANRYLHWHDIRLFKELGFDLYDFGGLDVDERTPKTANIAAFKRGFGGRVVPVWSMTKARSLRGAAARRILSLRGVDY
jgi:hypothetical protein